MKKQLFLLSALALTALVGCKGGNVPVGGKLKVGLICLHDEASTYDKNFISAFKASCDEAKEKGTIAEYSIVDNIEETQDCADAAERLINDGYKAIFTDSFGHDAFIHPTAAEHPDVFFSSATGIEARNAGLKNYHNAFASIYEGRYLAGVAAGEYLKQVKGKTEDSDVKIGYIGAKPYAEVISGYTSWYLGVKSVLPKVQMLVTYTNEWYHELWEGQAADALISEGCELISQHADSLGAPNACRLKNIPNVSYNVNTVEMEPLCANTYVGHSRINWKPYYDKAIEAASKGAETPVEGEVEQNWTGTLGTDSVEYNVSNLVPDKTNIENAEALLKAGKLHVFDCNKFTVNDLSRKMTGEGAPVKGTDYDTDAEGHLTMMKGDTTSDYARDTDLVATDKLGTYVQESHFRSAPSFDFIIDGIELLGQKTK